ncbi:MAG TPA: sigma 54-interacting transcriptional regulator [Candidatus Enterenecus stercoripullorum]|nr:sigma 54-interacting transcriptional regulator [Candidatus Enterenecus stercoripullorum]
MEESKKVNEELTYLRSQQAGNKQLLYRSAAMGTVMNTIASISHTDVTVLITGESGTGKELVASEIYQSSNRSGKPFIKVNCAAIPAELLESELFGYEDGAFTGARKNGKPGMFELANTGTILLDEIGDLSLPLQAKLLRVLQQKEFMRIGGVTPIKLGIGFATSHTLPVFTFLATMCLNMFIPSQGGMWVVEGRILLDAAQRPGADIPPVINAFVYGDGVTNLLQPLYLIAPLAVVKMKLKDVWGFTAFICVFWIIANVLGLYFIPMLF